MAPKIKIDSFSSASLYRKFSVAFVFMSLVPIVLIVYVVYRLNIGTVIEVELPYFRLTILLMVLLSLASFDIIRRSMVALGNFNAAAKEIANGKYDKRVDIKEDGEVGKIVASFNKVTDELETKVKELESSKRLLQNIFNKIGTAVTSTKGIENLLELILESLAQGTYASGGAIFLKDSHSSSFRLKLSVGLDGIDKNMVINEREGMIGRVANLKKLESASDVSTNSATYFEFQNSLAKDSIMVAPLVFKDLVLGVMLVSDKNTHKPFNRDDMLLLKNVTAQTSVAIKNYQLNEDIEKTYLDTITALAVAVEAKDPYSRGHIERVAEYVERLGSQMNLDQEIMRILRNGAILHDVGKIGVRDEILKKDGPLTLEEQNEMREHVVIGVNIIKPIRSMSALSDLVRYHQEFYDGSGYPDRLKGEEIPLTARILKVCDAYDAMTTDRPYRKALTLEETKRELISKSGKEFDPKIVEEFIKTL